MRRRVTGYLSAALALCLLATGLPMTAAAGPGLSKSLYQALEKVRNRIQDGQAEQALALLKQVDGQARDDYSRAIVEQTYGYAWVELDKLEAAAKAFRRALELDALPESAQNNVRYNLAGILARTGKSAEARRLLEAYLATEKDPPVQARILLAQLYLEAGNYQASVRLLEQVRAEQQQPDETVLLLLVSAYSEQKQLRRTLPLLQELIRIAPRRASYWQQLAAAHLSLGQDEQGLAVLESAYLQGLTLSTSQLQYLARLYLHQGLPYKAGRLIEKEMTRGHLNAASANRRLAAQAWQMARENEKAIATLQQAVADEEEPDLFQQLVGLYLVDERWDDAARVLEQGIAKTSGEQKDRMLVTLGMVRYRQQRPQEARLAFERVSQGTGSPQDQAAQWLQYLDYLELRRSESGVGKSQGPVLSKPSSGSRISPDR